MLDVMRVSNNIITDLRSPIYVPLCLHLISPNGNIKGYDVQSKKPKLLTSWTWKYYIPKIIASTMYLTSYTADMNGRWHVNISQYSGIIIIITLCMYFVWQWNLCITWLAIIHLRISDVHCDTGENFCLGGNDNQHLSISLCTHGSEEMGFVTEATEHRLTISSSSLCLSR